MREYTNGRAERDLRELATEDTLGKSRGFITPLLCFLPTSNRNWILTPLACLYRPTDRR